MIQQETMVGDHQFRFTALPSNRARSLLVKLLKNTEGALSVIKGDFLQSFTQRGVSRETMLGLAALLGSASAIDQLLQNLKPEFVDQVAKEVLDQCEVWDNDMWRKVQHEKFDFFQNRLGLQFMVMVSYLKWSYGDFLSAPWKETLSNLFGLIQKAQGQPDQQTVSTSSTTGSPSQSTTEVQA